MSWTAGNVSIPSPARRVKSNNVICRQPNPPRHRQKNARLALHRLLLQSVKTVI